MTGRTSIIDIGAGGCRIAAGLRAQGFEVTALDVVDHNTTDLPLKLYDGERIPFDDRSFDASVLAFVLHHARQPDALLQEAIRVTNGIVVILEDAPKNFIERQAWQAIDYTLNRMVHDDIEIGHAIKSSTAWRAYVQSVAGVDVEVSEFRHLGTTLGLYRHARIVLDVSAGRRTK